MIIHVVQIGDTIQSIADYYGISVIRLIQDNDLEAPNHLVIGQSIVIAIPEITYTIKEGDTLVNIANSFDVPVMQLLMNNPFLSNREFIYPGETIIISYSKKGSMTIHGNTAPNINRDILIKTLPYLTYLSIINFTATKEGEIITYYDDTEIISTAKEFDVMPLMLLTTLTIQGTANIGIEYDLLLNQDFQQRFINNALDILKTKGYYGVNISFQYINISNIFLYNQFFTLITDRLNAAGFHVFVTINPNISNFNNNVRFERVDYSNLNQLAQNIIFMNYNWASNISPPSPISSVYDLDVFLGYVNNFISPDKIIIGIPNIGYDWELPFLPGFSSVYSLTLNSAIALACSNNSTIQFDEPSQTPYFLYTQDNIQHIVWFIDARSINSLLDLAISYELYGVSIWNITVYNAQLWLIINSQYEIKKIVIE
ncbi:LysM peptidoglycan-binding domain-containing protein [Anaerocolumna sedimenticola]|uniref:LysM peptidoglycan-binding domain-containing protein n=1 Tax=Anaerocolumna sedimenticola TaxID=2696063 RepID=A0A6P1TP67_9FIRM|nr:LysM peptidoglycan-binding domain-containing protein [Anaerocolumna sedimenticola]QHQ61606.1 LysM peptidoglycan-binding domain-containing protein [Anaerocolumna sedimenticola]